MGIYSPEVGVCWGGRQWVENDCEGRVILEMDLTGVLEAGQVTSYHLGQEDSDRMWGFWLNWPDGILAKSARCQHRH